MELSKQYNADERDFVTRLIQTGKAVRLKPGESLPPGVTHEIVDTPDGVKVYRRRFAAQAGEHG
jgi:hypothetical protein